MSKKKKKRVKRSRKKSRKVKRSRKRSRKVKKSRKRKTSKKRQTFKAPTYSKDSDGNIIIKVSDSWANQAYVNGSKYKKNTSFLLKKMKNSGVKKEKEFLGSKNIQKLKM